MSNSLGKTFRVTSFGESHGRCIGVVVDGCPSGLPLEPSDVQHSLDRRRPGQSSVTTARREGDKVEFLSGVFNGRTTGAPICMIVWNRDQDSSGYEARRWTPRPGHADWTAHIRFGGFNDYRGGGRFSGRITASYVMAGAIAKKLLSSTLNIEILAHTKKINGIEAPDCSVESIRENVEGNQVRCAEPKIVGLMLKALEKAKSEGDSVGGVVECLTLNLPPGVGDPVFDTLEGDLAKALFAIPAVKAVEFGLGTKFSSTRGSEVNDVFVLRDGGISTETNNAGGILGGISSGMPISCLVTFKPTPSIGRAQKTVDLTKMEAATLEIEGRHDPCVVPRAVPVVECVVATVLADHVIRAGLIPRILRSG
jgi:chorismate synthase